MFFFISVGIVRHKKTLGVLILTGHKYCRTAGKYDEKADPLYRVYKLDFLAVMFPRIDYH